MTNKNTIIKEYFQNLLKNNKLPITICNNHYHYRNVLNRRGGVFYKKYKCFSGNKKLSTEICADNFLLPFSKQDKDKKIVSLIRQLEEKENENNNLKEENERYRRRYQVLLIKRK